MEHILSLTHAQVLEVLPHRDPMLLVDEAPELVPGTRVVTTFYADPARDIFRGHFPGAPVLPGVYTVEAAAQAACLLLLTRPEYAGKTPLFLGIDRTSFRRKILPGDTLEVRAALVSERPEKAIAACQAQVYVAGELAAETQVTLAMR